MKEDIYYFPIQMNKSFEIQMAGISYCDGSYHITRQCSDVHVIEYIVSGKGTVEADEQSNTAVVGDVYYLPANIKHNYYSDSKDPWIKIFFNISGDLVNDIANAYKIRRKIIYNDFGKKELFYNFIDTIKSGHSREMQEKCILIFHEIVQELSRHLIEELDVPKDILLVKNYLDSNALKKINIKNLCDITDKSADYITKHFKIHYKNTPYEYFLNKKISIAKEMLLNTNLSVKEISSRLAFDDQHYFSMLFKQYAGVSPKNFRNSILG